MAEHTKQGPVVAGLAIGAVVLFVFAYFLGELNRPMTSLPQPQPVQAERGVVPVYQLECGDVLDAQIAPNVSRAILLVPPCKCSQMTNLEYDCTGWVRILGHRGGMTLVNLDARTTESECIFWIEFSKERAQQGVPANTPLPFGDGCKAVDDRKMKLKIKGLETPIEVMVPDRLTVENFQSLPIRIQVELFN